MKNLDIEKLRGFAIFSVLLQHLSITPPVFELLNLNSKNMPFYLGVERHIFSNQWICGN
jgi:peptidoglycan/LPS O-acetylase OafA/YrhL